MHSSGRDRDAGLSDSLADGSDEQLIADLRTGSAEAFETLYRRYYAPLWEFAYRYTHSREGAEDVVHEVFRALWERREAFGVRVGLRQYLFGVVRNLGIKWQEHERVVRLSALQGDGNDVAGVGTAPRRADELLESAEIDEILTRVLREMPELRRQVLILRWRAGMSYTEIAETMGISVEAAQAHVSRAQRVLRPMLRRLLGDE